MSHPLEAFASSLDLDASKVTNSPSLIFLCGGPIDPKPGVDPSLRAIFYQHLKVAKSDLQERVLLAEEANKWSRNSKHYDNLFDLENDLAYLSDVILLFVESAGSFAELGAFCQARALRNKLVAILEEGYWQQKEPSFIRDGPVAYLENLEDEDHKSVLVYDWLGPEQGDGRRPLKLDRAQSAANSLLNWLTHRSKERRKETRFRKTYRGHILLLLSDLIDLGSVLQIREIRSLLDGLGISIGWKRLDRYLYLLENLDLVHKTKSGHRDYYLAGGKSAEYLHYAYKLSSKADAAKRMAWERLRVQLDLREQLWKLHPDRKSVFERFLDKSEK